MKLEHLKRFTFFAGDNNVGKTTLLESIFAWARGFDFELFFLNAIVRNYPMGQLTAYGLADIISASFHDRSAEAATMTFSGSEEDGVRKAFVHQIQSMGSITDEDAFHRMPHGIQIEVANHQVFPKPEQIVVRWQISSDDERTKPFDIGLPLALPRSDAYKRSQYIGLLGHRKLVETVKIYRELKTKGKMETFLHDFQQVFPEVVAFESIPYPDATPSPISLKLQNGKLLPLYAFGEGLQRWYFILGSIILNHHGIFCIDEIDATIHPGAQRAFCENLIRYATKYDAQLFMTTHNLEFLDHFLAAAQEHDIAELSVVTMKKNKAGAVRVRNLQGEDVADARSYDLELR